MEERHAHLNEEIGCANMKLAELMRQCPCRDPAENIALMRDDECRLDDILVKLSAPCGSRVRIQTDLIVPGQAVYYALTLFPHHEERIADIKGQLTIIKGKQEEAGRRLRPGRCPRCCGADAPVQVADCLREGGLFRHTGAVEGDNNMPDIAQITADVAQKMIYFWAKARSNMCIKLALLEKEQREGVIKHVDDTATFEIENFNWAWHGLWTIRVVNETAGHALFQNLWLNVLPTRTTGHKSWREWFEHCIREPYHVFADTHMPSIGAPLVAEKKTRKPTVQRVQKRLVVDPNAIPVEKLGQYVFAYARDMNIGDPMKITHPDKLLRTLAQHGPPEAKRIVERVQEVRANIADQTVRYLQARNRHADAGELLASEPWDSFTSAAFCGDAQVVALVSCHDVPCANHENPEERDRIAAKACRAAERQLLNEAPYFAFVAFIMNSCKHLQDFVHNRSTSRRWSLTDLSDTNFGPSTVIIETNNWMRDQIERINVSPLAKCMKDVIAFGPILCIYFSNLCEKWTVFTRELVDLDSGLSRLRATSQSLRPRPCSD